MSFTFGKYWAAALLAGGMALSSVAPADAHMYRHHGYHGGYMHRGYTHRYPNYGYRHYGYRHYGYRHYGYGYQPYRYGYYHRPGCIPLLGVVSGDYCNY